MKSISIALITYSNVDMNKSGLYRYADTDALKVLLCAYSINDQDEIHIVDFTNREYIPAKIVKLIDNPNVVKYTFGFEYERLCLSKCMRRKTPFPIELWKSTAELAHNFSMPDSLEELCKLFKLELPDCSYIEYCKNLFCRPKTMSVRERRIRQQEYPVLWKKMREYCCWIIKAEKAVRYKLYQYVISEMWFHREYLKRKYSIKGVEIDETLLKKHKQEFLNQIYQLKNNYEILYDGLCDGDEKLYKDFLGIVSQINDCFRQDYRYISWRKCRNSKYHDVDWLPYELNMPLMLSKVAIPETDTSFCLINLSQTLLTVVNMFEKEKILYGNNFEKVDRAVKFVIEMHRTMDIGLLKIFWEAGMLRIQLPTDNILTYINPQICNGKVDLFCFDGYDESRQWQRKESSVESLIMDVSAAILQDIILEVAMQMDSYGINIAAISKEGMLLEIKEEEMKVVKAILNQITVCKVNVAESINVIYPAENKEQV